MVAIPVGEEIRYSSDKERDQLAARSAEQMADPMNNAISPASRIAVRK
ncbi:MAG TPA: hypothetical protein VKB76_07000 [Ktedonobacterales bacterium]|nr:hypothetical protein [Ktedonobacterales bacterium]